jgi:hypothetical protein
MKHYAIEKWADFARDAMREEEKKEMRSHLESGCGKCAKIFGTWKQVHAAALRESAYQPPDSVVRMVKGLGVIHGLGKARPAKSPIAELLFDSFRTPMLAGVRSSSVTARQLLFGVGDYRLDLRIEPQDDSDKVALLGQILNSSQPDQAIDVVPVVLRRGNKILAEAMTNQFGEFQLEFDLVSSLQLEAGLPHGQVLRVPLVEPVSETATKLPEVDDSNGVTKILRATKKSTRKKV